MVNAFIVTLIKDRMD